MREHSLHTNVMQIQKSSWNHVNLHEFQMREMDLCVSSQMTLFDILVSYDSQGFIL